MKALILSCSTGEGHNSAAKAIYEEMLTRNITCYFVDALSFGNKKVAKIVTDSFNKIAVKSPRTFGIMYKAGNIVSNSVLKSPVYAANILYAKELMAFIEKNNFDVIVCSHLFPMEALTYLKKKHNLKSKCYGILTDYTCIPFLEETNMDGYFIPHKDLKKEFILHKIPSRKLICLGIPVSNKFNDKIPKEKARKYLELPNNKTILIMTGGVGCGNILEICNNLLRNIDINTNIIVLVGKNKELNKQLKKEFKLDKRIISVPFTDKVALYMDASDVLLSKPGGLSTTEAAVKNIPLIHTMPIPGCETKNAFFYAKHKMALTAHDIEEIVSLTIALLNDKKRQKSMLINQKKYINSNGSKDIVDYIIKKL